MPLQNRVTPFGEIVAIAERGTMLGNRGVLHDEHRSIVRKSQVRRWICCVLERKGIRRTVMSPRSWTELFFLDEATALSAGHRPCFECRRADALAFQAAWARAFAISPPRADAMDRVLAADRADRGVKKTFRANGAALPDGALVAREGAAYLVLGRRYWRWGAGGYDAPEAVASELVEVLTPRATIAVLTAGYSVATHPSCV